MANLHIKGIDDDLYARIKNIAAAENRSVSQQILFVMKSYLANPKRFQETKTSAERLLELAGSWEDDRDIDEIITIMEPLCASTGELKTWTSNCPKNSKCSKKR